jgi:hypothetical protein
MELKDFFIVDVKDMTNWIALAIAIPLLWWGLSTIISIARSS